MGGRQKAWLRWSGDPMIPCPLSAVRCRDIPALKRVEVGVMSPGLGVGSGPLEASALPFTCPSPWEAAGTYSTCP